MEVLEYAKQMEQDGIDYYTEQRDSTNHPGFKRILGLLIHEEQKHYDFFDQLSKGKTPTPMEQFPFGSVKNIFQLMRDRREHFDFSDEQVAIYKKALEIEKESEDFYRHAALKVENRHVKEQIQQVADEEQRHAVFIDSLVEYLERPEQWVEHAMFTEKAEPY